MSQKGSRLDGVFAAVLDRRRARNQLRQLTTVPDGMVDFSSNAYLSLSSQPAVQQAFLARLHAAAASPCPNSTTATSNTTNTGSSGNGSSSSNIINTSQPTTPSPSPPPPPPPLLGAGGSRLLDGNSARAEALERAVAAFHRAPAGLLFNSALDANVGLFASAPQPGDAVVYDALVHASVHDGMRLSRVPRERRRPFAHGRVWAAAAAAGPGGNGGRRWRRTVRGCRWRECSARF
ncbi:9006ba80-925a-4b3f-94ae-d02d8dc1eca4 [Thermothielavioides terrestris]|uniref:9006ba80-925a-4b3f-94ae-d02d8dc1eca4 n=1 Tax=Thermothielavioides terrestris TaxID=2587410 RepID=A0A446BBQ4_9PEZI|nr:9006ba80-925a-4b3f-94ae-d02d8dc1eca4 [Thermothielavioides terrestris]